jgi:hypothetical protein
VSDIRTFEELVEALEKLFNSNDEDYFANFVEGMYHTPYINISMFDTTYKVFKSEEHNTFRISTDVTVKCDSCDGWAYEEFDFPATKSPQKIYNIIKAIKDCEDEK